MNEPDQHPSRHQRCLHGDHRVEQLEVGAFGLRRAGMVAGDRVIGQASQQVPFWAPVASRGGVLEAPHPQVTAGDADKHGAGKYRLPLYRAPGPDYGQGSGRRDAQGVHPLADDVFAQHWSYRGEAVATAGERRGPGTFEVDVENAPVGVNELAQQQCAPVA